jgi:hypothetical protein
MPRIPLVTVPQPPETEEAILLRSGQHQLLYVVFDVGTEDTPNNAPMQRTYVFLGPPIPDEIAEKVSTIAFGPIVPASALPEILGNTSRKQ